MKRFHSSKGAASIVIALLFIVSNVLIGQESDQGKKEQGKMHSSVNSKKKIAVMETSMGTVEFELYTDDAPKTTENFMKLAEKKFFNGMRIHRVSKGFVIQTGDEKSKDLKQVNAWGTGGQSIWGKPFADELVAATPSYKEGYKRGIVAMANAGPNTNTSQFFICLMDLPKLPHNYTIFGKVVNGMDVVDKIGNVDIIPGQMGPTDGRPKTDVMVKKITIK
ncbi:MAG TPA: peptidylprolyl isomerase [Bacteroidota bacterium]|nr:peptidylprolyl isomerase [Bacteroidota bacterium]